MLEKAEAFAAGCIESEDAVFAIDDARHEVALLVDVGGTLLSGHFPGRRGHEGDELWKLLLELVGFLKSEGSTGIAFDAAFAEAGVEVTFEITFYHVERDEGVVDLEHELILNFEF